MAAPKALNTVLKEHGITKNDLYNLLVAAAQKGDALAITFILSAVGAK